MRATADQLVREVRSGKRRVNALTSKGYRIVHHAIFEGRLDLVQELKKRKADLNLLSREGLSPISCAAFLGRAEQFGTLLKQNFPDSIPIFRNRDQQFHLLPHADLVERVGMEDYLCHLQFANRCDLEWAIRRGKRVLKQSYYARMNRWLLALHQAELRRVQQDHIYIRWINPRLGYGVFAKRPLSKLCFIGEYTGVIRRRKESVQTPFNDYIFSYMVGQRDTPFIIDAQTRGNFARFINHSNRPNILSRSLILDGIPRIILFTKDRVKVGEQLTYDYGQYYWRSRRAPLMITTSCK